MLLLYLANDRNNGKTSVPNTPTRIPMMNRMEGVDDGVGIFALCKIKT
jgi:hypothetical protein